jgi:hypothetical protein
MSHIESVVDEMLANETVNIKYLPDFVIKRLYLNMIHVASNILGKTVQTSKIELLGHEISMKFKETKDTDNTPNKSV